VPAGEDKPSIAPVELAKVKKGTSGYGKRWHPILKKIQFHTGIDFEMPEGEVVMAAANGVVVESIFHSQRGNYVVVKHGDRYTTSYSHLRNAVVKAGDKIEKGQTLGYVGSTGWSTGAHLHYEVLKNGHTVDPIGYF
jgi:murein DD-endopeptidase MepM/ murein hydrolase activator NlpD